MAIISSFLCWSNTRTGSAVCGYYTLIVSVVCLAFYMLRYIALDEMKDSVELKGIVYAGFVLYSFLIGVSLVLLPGVYMDQKFLLLPWIYVLVIAILYETGAIALITTVHLEQDQTLHVWEIVAIAFYCVRLIVNCYSFACVVSQYQELSEGRGTFEFLFKPHRRHMTGSITTSDSEEYNPPYGATLPPYSESNPYKEYSPPNYENLSLEFQDLGGFATSFRREASMSSDRMGDHISSPCLADVAVDQSLSDYDSDTDTYSRVDPCGDIDTKFNSSCSESSDENSDYPTIPERIELSMYALPQTGDHHEYSHYRNQHRGGSFNAAVAMTSSSACLMEYPSDRFAQSWKRSRSKLAPISHLSIQKRTYITWI